MTVEREMLILDTELCKRHPFHVMLALAEVESSYIQESGVKALIVND